MNDGKFTIWVVEDQEDPNTMPWHAMLADTFGYQKEATVSWDLFTTARATIGALLSGRSPDIALVDVNLRLDEDNEATDTVGEYPDTRGLVVAAALQSLSPKPTIVVLYTANEEVEGIQSRVLAVPPVLEKLGVRPLIQIKRKAKESAPEAVLPWIEREIRRQAEKRVRVLGSSSTESRELCEVLIRIEGGSAAVTDASVSLERGGRPPDQVCGSGAGSVLPPG